MKKSHALSIGGSMRWLVPASLALLAWLANPSLVLAQDNNAATPRSADYQPRAGEPEVIIRPGKDATYYEYRVKGELVEIRVEPSVGPVYYLVPAEGDGFLRQDGSQLAVPSWVLFEW